MYAHTSPMASICLILVSTAWVGEGTELSFTTGREMVSALLNIFIALRLLVDHSRITPSREPDAKKLPTRVREQGILACLLVWGCAACQKKPIFQSQKVQISKQCACKVHERYLQTLLSL